MPKKIYLFLIAILILLSGFSYRNLVFNFRGELCQWDSMTGVYNTRRTFLEYELPYQETLFLKIKTPQEHPVEKINFNGYFLQPHQANLRGEIYSYYVFIPKTIVSADKNNLRIELLKPAILDIDVRLRNYRKKISEDLLIFFPDSHIFNAGKSLFDFLLPLFIPLLICFILGMALTNFFILPFEKIYQYTFLIFLPAIVIPGLVYFVPLISGFKVAMSGKYFFSFQIFWIVLSGGTVLARQFLKFRNRSEELQRVFSPAWIEKFQGAYLWIAGREFSDKCIILSIALLGFCAFLLIVHLEPVAEQCANTAYLALAVGVTGKFVSLIRRGD